MQLILHPCKKGVPLNQRGVPTPLQIGCRARSWSWELGAVIGELGVVPDRFGYQSGTTWVPLGYHSGTTRVPLGYHSGTNCFL